MVLVVDDDEQIALMLKGALEKAGYRVETADSGVGAYGYLKQASCRCMLLDINIPKINGVELLMLMQAEGVDVPAIVLAGFPDFRGAELKEFTNVVDFFGKPFDLETLLAAVRKHAKPQYIPESMRVGKGL